VSFSSVLEEILTLAPNWICFRLSAEFCVGPPPAMTATFVKFIRIWRINSVGILRKLAMLFVLKVYWDYIRIWVKSSDISGCLVLYRTEFQQPGSASKTITPKPLIISGHANNRWKEEKVFYNSCIGLLVIFPSEQSQICTLWLLLTVKSSSTSVPMFSIVVLLVDWACPLAMVFHWHAWSSDYIHGCSIHKVVLIHRTNS
jgi:hypothetical protein